MLTEYIQAAMNHAQYEMLEDGTFFGRVPELAGLWANAGTLEECRRELQSTLEDWILVRISRHRPVPALDGIDLNIAESVA